MPVKYKGMLKIIFVIYPNKIKGKFECQKDIHFNRSLLYASLP